MAMMAQACDALPMESFFWPMVSSKEYGRTAPLHNCHADLTNTLIHVRCDYSEILIIDSLLIALGNHIEGLLEIHLFDNLGSATKNLIVL